MRSPTLFRRRVAMVALAAVVAGALGIRVPPAPAGRRPPVSAFDAGRLRRPRLPAAAPLPPPPPAATLETPPRPAAPRPAPPAPRAQAPYYRQLGQAGLAHISYLWRRLAYRLTFAPARAGLLGATSCATHDILVFVRPSETVGEVAFVTAFEIAHAVDCTFLTARSRAEWAQTRGFRGYPAWFPGCTCSEDDHGSGDYAEVFATWQVGQQFPWRSQLAAPPDPAEMQRLVPYLAVGS